MHFFVVRVVRRELVQTVPPGSFTPFATLQGGPCVQAQPGGGDERDRTDDPLLAKQVLSQLSYTPIYERCSLSSP